MSALRKFQCLIFLVSIAVGLLSLLFLHPKGRLSWADSILSPQKNQSFRVGAHIEDAHSDNSRDRITRKIAPPSHDTLNYVVCEIDDDPEQINAFGIYHPADLAITLNNLRQQRVETLFISTHLHWPDLDPAERNTLSSAFEQFDSVVITTPLRRALGNDPLPKVWLRSSIPAESVAGNAELIPAVNTLSLPPNIRIPENTFIGFSQLETEKQSERIPLIAQWDGRIIFSSTLLALAQHCSIEPSEISIVLDSYLRLGNTGNIIPIDAFGYFQPDLSQETPTPPRTITSALSGEASIIGATQKSAILTATGLKSSQYEAITNPYQLLSLLEKTPRVSSPKTLHRLPLWLECLLVAITAFLCALLLAYNTLLRHTSFLVAAGVILGLFLVLYHTFSYWSPISPYIITLFAGWTLTLILAKPARRKLT